jgi:hypothetical protein
VGRWLFGGSTAVKLLRLTLVAILVSCGTEEGGNETTATAAEAVVQNFSMTVTLPGGVQLQRIAVGANVNVELRDRVNVTGDTASATNDVIVANDARVGNLSAKRNVRVGDRSRVTGNVRAGGTSRSLLQRR